MTVTRTLKKKKMETSKGSIVGLLLFCAAFAPCIAIDGSCMELGYTSNLMCSSCRELREFNLQSLESECNQCCQPDGTNMDDKVNIIIRSACYILDLMTNQS